MKKFILSAALFLLCFFLLPGGAMARVISSDQPLTIGAEDVVEGDLYIAGPQVVVEGTVEGDLYAAGGTVTVTGNVRGDILAAGGNIRISGDVGQDVRVMGGMVTVEEATIGDSLTVFGGNLRVEEDSTVGGGLTLGVGNAQIAGDISRGIVGGAGSLTLSSAVGNDVEIGVGTFSLVNNAQVTGDINYQSGDDLSLSEEATISGEINRRIPQEPDFDAPNWQRARKSFRAGLRTLRVIAFLSALLVGSLFIYLFGTASEKISKNIFSKPWQSLLWGFLGLMLFPPLFILLLITVLGIPVAFMLAAAFGLVLYLAKIFVALVLGRALLELFGNVKYNVYLALGLGLASYYILGVIPVLGFYVTTLATFFGLGATLLFLRKEIQ